MQRHLLKSKLHRVTITHAELNYMGSCAIDEDLLDAADILEHERIDIWNINNGERFSTYAIRAERGSGIISVRGSAARRVQVGDILIIATFGVFEDAEARHYHPRTVFVDEQNRVVTLDEASTVPQLDQKV